MKLLDKKALIVGGGSELAAAICHDLLEAGAELYLVDIDLAKMQQVIEKNPAYAGKIHMSAANVCSLEAMQSCAADMKNKLGRIDIMVYVAGIIKHHPIVEMTEDDWKSVLDVNLNGCFHACKAVVPYMKEQHYGRIVNISSIGGRTARACGCNYAASKAGMIGISRILALELAQDNITVNTVAPGPLRGVMFDTMEPERIAKLESGIPLQRMGLMTDISPAVAYLASDDASWMTGEVIDINGGLFI